MIRSRSKCHRRGEVPVNDKDLQIRADFWKSIPLEELAEQQAVSAVSHLDEISALWPADDDPDELLRHILLERTERRELQSSPSAPTTARDS